MAVQVAQRVAGRPAARRGQLLAFVHQLGQLLFHILVFVVGGAPAGLPHDVPRFGVHHDPAAVHEGQLLPGLVEDVGDPLHRAFFARLTGGIQRDLLAAGGHPVDLHGLLAHQKRRVAGGKEIVVHAVGAGVIRRSLLHIAEQGAGFELPVKITVGV